MKKSGGRYTRYKVSYSWEGDCEMGENKMPHIQLPENLGIRYAVLPGDPARAERAADGRKTALPNLRRFVRHSTASDEEI